MSWQEIVEAASAGKELTLDELIELARGYEMTAEEVAAQRESLARGFGVQEQER